MEAMTEERKRHLKLFSFLPMVAFAVAIGYNLFVLRDLIDTRTLQNHIGVATDMSQHYTALFILYAVAATISAVVLLYFVVHVARLKALNGPTKVMWIVVLVAIVPISFVLFYFAQIRNEPKLLQTYPDIA